VKVEKQYDECKFSYINKILIKKNSTSFFNSIGKQLSVYLLTKQSSHQLYNTIPKSQEWLIMNFLINATTNTFLLGFYILKDEKL
jgi:hypothetical protein